MLYICAKMQANWERLHKSVHCTITGLRMLQAFRKLIQCTDSVIMPKMDCQISKSIWLSRASPQASQKGSAREPNWKLGTPTSDPIILQIITWKAQNKIDFNVTVKLSINSKSCMIFTTHVQNVHHLPQERVYRDKIRTVEELQQRIMEEWECVDQHVIAWL